MEAKDCFGQTIEPNDYILYPKVGKSAGAIRALHIARVRDVREFSVKTGKPYRNKAGEPLPFGLVVRPLASRGTYYQDSILRSDRVLLRNMTKVVKITPDMVYNIVKDRTDIPEHEMLSLSSGE